MELVQNYTAGGKIKILVTGAEGFIGSHLVEELVRESFDVTAGVLYNFKSDIGWLSDIDKHLLEFIKIKFYDARDFHSTFNAIQGCDAVINLAALISVPYSFESPMSYLQTNISGTINLLEACRSIEISRIVQISSSEVYGTGKSLPINEQHPLNAQSPYAASKVAADQFSLAYFHSFGLPVTVVRPFNTFGPRQSLRAIIPTIINQLLLKSELHLGSINTTRDFTYVTDTVKGIISALKAKNIEGEQINLGTGMQFSVEEIIKNIAEIMGKTNINISVDDKRIRPNLSEVQVLCSDNQKAKNKLNWSPDVDDAAKFTIALENTVNWYIKNINSKNLNHNSLYNV